MAPRHLLTVEVLCSGLPAEFDGTEAVQEVGAGIASSGQDLEESNPMNGDAGWQAAPAVAAMSPPQDSVESPQEDSEAQDIGDRVDEPAVGQPDQSTTAACGCGPYPTGAVAAGLIEWQNEVGVGEPVIPVQNTDCWPGWRLDVNGDELVTPLDALMIANSLQSPDLAPVDLGMLDVDGDGWITGADFAAVATHLNLATADTEPVQAASEGEAIWEEYCEQLKASAIDYFSQALTDAIASGAPQSTIDFYSAMLAHWQAVDCEGEDPGSDTDTDTDTDTDDDEPYVTVAEAAILEPDLNPDGTRQEVQLSFSVSLSAASSKNITVNYATAIHPIVGPLTPHDSGPAQATPGVDFVMALASSSLSFPAGTTTSTISVTILGDISDEYDEQFQVKLTGGTNVKVGNNGTNIATLANGGIAVGTILDNDEAPDLIIEDIIVQESGGTAEFVATLSHPTEKRHGGLFETYDFTGYEWTALSHFDYEPTSVFFGPLTGVFPSGQTSRTISVPIIADTLDEGSEIFQLMFWQIGSNLNQVKSSAKATIVGIDLRVDANNDGEITVADDPESDQEFETAKPGKMMNVDEFAEIQVLKGAVTGLDGFQMVITTSGDAVKLWTSPAKTEEIPNNKTYVIGADSIPASIYAEGIQSGTAIVTAKVADSDGDEYKSDEVRVSVLKIQKILEVDYFGNHALVSDPNSQGQTTSYTALPEWNDKDQNGTAGDSDGERRYPVVYTRNSVLKLEAAKIQADLTGLDAGSLDQIMVRATANHNGIEIEKTEATVAGDEIKITNVTAAVTEASDGNFHNKVDYLLFKLAWQVSLDKGANWIDAGESSTAVYLTHKDPQTLPLYHTMVHIGSTNGKNATDHDNEAEVLDAIWQKFEGLQIHAVAYNASTGTIVQGPLLKYWDAGINTQMGPSTASLLQHADGRCQPWANFFVDVVKAQGIAGYHVHPFGPAAGPGFYFLVKNWEFIGNGSLAETLIGTAGFKYLLIDPPDGGDYPNDDLNKVAGIKGQGDNDNPRSIFPDHVLVRYSALGQTRYYDPSYGLGPYATDTEWMDDALAGIAIFVGQEPELPPEHYRFAVKKL